MNTLDLLDTKIQQIKSVFSMVNFDFEFQLDNQTNHTKHTYTNHKKVFESRCIPFMEL